MIGKDQYFNSSVTAFSTELNMYYSGPLSAWGEAGAGGIHAGEGWHFSGREQGEGLLISGT